MLYCSQDLSRIPMKGMVTFTAMKKTSNNLRDGTDSSDSSNSPQKFGHARRILPIHKRIWQRVLIRWGIVLAVGVACTVFCLASRRFYPTQMEYNFGVFLTVVVFLAVVGVSRVFPLTVSRGWTGKVIGREVKKYTKFAKGLATRSSAVLSTACVWTVEKDDGYIEKVTYDTDDVWERYFEIGERVRLYKNAKIMVKAHPPRGEENLMCPLCGQMVMEPVCRKCGVDFTETEQSNADESA